METVCVVITVTSVCLEQASIVVDLIELEEPAVTLHVVLQRPLGDEQNHQHHSAEGDHLQQCHASE